MMKLSVGDLVFIAFAIFSVLLMLLMGLGQHGGGDTEAEQQSRDNFLRQIERPRSAALTVAMIIAMSAFAYVFVALVAKAT